MTEKRGIKNYAIAIHIVALILFGTLIEIIHTAPSYNAAKVVLLVSTGAGIALIPMLIGGVGLLSKKEPLFTAFGISWAVIAVAAYGLIAGTRSHEVRSVPASTTTSVPTELPPWDMAGLLGEMSISSSGMATFGIHNNSPSWEVALINIRVWPYRRGPTDADPIYAVNVSVKPNKTDSATFKVITAGLDQRYLGDQGYNFKWKIISAYGFGAPSRTAQEVSAAFASMVNEQVPDWEEIDASPAFRKFLMQSDSAAAMTRDEILMDAAHRYDAQTAISIFNEFKRLRDLTED